MKTIFTILVLLLTLASQATPVYLRTLKPDGVTPETNAVVITPWPPNAPFYTSGTNIIAGLGPMTNVPNASGFWSNSLAPIVFTVRYTNAPTLGYFVKVWDTTNYASLATYVTNVPVAQAAYGTMFGLVTNWLGYFPATNTPSGIIFALGFQPATNSTAGITNALGYIPATNSVAGIIASLGYTPATNTFNGITNSLKYLPATNGGSLTFMQVSNALSFYPATNTVAGITSAIGYTPATNSAAGIVAALGFQPATNQFTFTTASAPTNAYVTGSVYTNASTKGFLRGYAVGGILWHTNAGLAYALPVTNNFTEPLGTNDTFQFTGGNITNVVFWK